MYGCKQQGRSGIDQHIPTVRGWNLLSDDVLMGLKALQKASDYQINHLQLSHHLIMDLKDVRDRQKLQSTRKLVKSAHDQGIEKVFVWDHALYDLDYYPDEFKTSDGLIDLDDAGFWRWVKNDYRSMLDSLPDIQGIILTFIETGANVEDQYSSKWKTEEEKLAHLVDSVASVVIDERKLELFIRTFIYHKAELESLLGCVNLVRHPDVKVMTKEVPHDFFLTHPVSDFVTEFDKEVIIEFDLGHEYHGQGVIASILPEITIERWKYYASRENVIGYVARTDRYHNTQNIGRPTEVNLFALRRVTEDTTITAEEVVEEFISLKYGREAVPALKTVFLETDDIITSVFYTLGLHMNSHSRLDFDYTSIYSRHCSGKWLDDPQVTIGHDVNKRFHYWKDIVENLSPARHKIREQPSGRKTTLYREAPWVINSGWVTPEDKMNLEYLGYIITQKEYGIQKAEWALNEVRKSRTSISDVEDFNELLQLYERTYLTARLYLATAKAYFGYRSYLNDGKNEKIKQITREALYQIDGICEEMLAYPHKEPHGQFTWIDDVRRARELKQKITSGWDLYDNRRFDAN